MVILALGTLLLGLVVIPHYIPITCSKPQTAVPHKNEIYIEILGDIIRPGIYTFSHEPTVCEVINQAGGLKKKGIFKKHPDAVTVKSGSRLIIKVSNDRWANVSYDRMEGKALLLFGLPIDVNKATLSDLTFIPGIGETLAQNIMQFRESYGGFRTLEDLKKVKGIGEKRFNKLRRYLTISP
ncbi:MAG TPA: helix-hairpin-helix domain-containing protein [Syntrophaceae bacterium]|nr:helix-hairpin-helix domain-containing protein [Syntrophaceae bacterium]